MKSAVQKVLAKYSKDTREASRALPRRVYVKLESDIKRMSSSELLDMAAMDSNNIKLTGHKVHSVKVTDVETEPDGTLLVHADVIISFKWAEVSMGMGTMEVSMYNGNMDIGLVLPVFDDEGNIS